MMLYIPTGSKVTEAVDHALKPLNQNKPFKLFTFGITMEWKANTGSISPLTWLSASEGHSLTKKY